MGSGKSTLLRVLVGKLSPTEYHFAYIADSHLAPASFYDQALRELSVAPAYRFITPKLPAKSPSFDSGFNSVTMPAGLVEELQKLSVTQELERVQAGPDYEDYGLVFCTDTGRPISPRNLVRQFKSLLQKAGLPNVRFHDLRHTHASLLLELGVHDKVVSERPGHASIDITMNTYAHVMSGLQEQAAAAFDTLLKRIEGQPS